MIGRLQGKLIEKNPPQIIVDCGGVGYEVDVPMSTFYQLAEVNQNVTLLTHMVVREDAQLLYGFASASEREAFRQLIKISGVGPRSALTILSGMSVDELLQSVTEQNVTRMVKIPGIGKKTAERLLLELRDKLDLTKASASLSPRNNKVHEDIAQALLTLGYNRKEVDLGTKDLAVDVSVEQGIKQALKTLSK